MQEAYSRINNFCLMVLAAVALTAALIYTKAVLLPFVIALFIYTVITPVIRFLTLKLKVPWVISIFLTILIYFVLTGALVFFVSNSLEQFIRSAGAYRDRLVDFIQWAVAFAEGFGFEVEDRTVREEIRNIPVFSMARSLSGGILSFMGNATLIFIFVLFLVFGDKGKLPKNPFILTVQKKISKYIITKTTISIITGCLVGILLLIFGVDLTFMFVILTILLNFIPSIGSIIATLMPLPVLILQFGFTSPLYIILIASGLIQFSIGNVIEPKFMGDSMDLHPVAVLMFLIFWGLVWGIPGMFLAVPITAVLKIVLSRIETTKPLAELLGGRLPQAFDDIPLVSENGKDTNELQDL
jgi:AI-2 transport protein TqsA